MHVCSVHIPVHGDTNGDTNTLYEMLKKMLVTITEDYSGPLSSKNGKQFLCSILELYFKTWSLTSPDLDSVSSTA